MDIGLLYGISVSSFYSNDGVLWPTIAAINDTLSMDLDLNEISNGFSKYSYGRIRFI